MKKLIAISGLLLVLGACKKDKKSNNFTQTDVTGTTVVKGNVSKAVITPNGSGGWNNNSRIAAKGVQVSITVNKNSLYPNSTAQGADIYTATTDDNGNYSVNVRSNATGVNAKITIDGFTGTLDTLVNGVTRTGAYSTFAGTSTNVNLVMGQNFTFNYDFSASNVVSNPNNLNVGTAVVTGSIGIEYLKETVIAPNPPFFSPTVVPVPAGHKVYLRLANDPNTGSPKVYETTTDGNGFYQFTVNTVAMGTNGFNQNAEIWIEDHSATRDTLKANNTVKTGLKGVYQMETRNQNGVYKNGIKNANHLSYTNFIAD